MSAKFEFPIKVFYDGSCNVCSTKMYTYMGKDHGGRLEFVDVTAQVSIGIRGGI